MTAAAKPEQEPAGTAVATTPKRELGVADLPQIILHSKSAQAKIRPFLPAGIALDRIAAAVYVALAKDRAAWATACRNDPKKSGPSPLEKCAPMSVLLAVAKITQWGLEVGETAHLVPFGGECTPVADYKGLVQLVMATGLVRGVQARCVFKNELFKMRLGTSVDLNHEPMWSQKDRGPMVGAYAVFDLRGNALPVVKYMGVDEIEAHRQKHSKQWKNGALPEWYAEKTVIRMGVKLLPKDPRFAKTIALFEGMEEEAPVAIPAELQHLESVGTIAAPVDGAAEGGDWELDDDEPATLEV